MATIELIADYECGEGSIELSDDFLSESKLMQADLLKDWIGGLTDVYNQTIADFWEDNNDKSST